MLRHYGASLRYGRNRSRTPYVEAGQIVLYQAAVIIVSSLILLSCSADAQPNRPAGPDLSKIHPFTLNGCSGIAEPSTGRGSCDPLNLVFPESSVQDVQKALLAAGWTASGLGSAQAIVIAGSGAVQLQGSQLFKDDRTSLESLPSRYHVRLWDIPGGAVLGAVHHETGFLVHTIDKDWELAEAEVRADLCAKAICAEAPLFEEQWQLQGRDDEWRGKRNDARASVIVLR